MKKENFERLQVWIPCTLADELSKIQAEEKAPTRADVVRKILYGFLRSRAHAVRMRAYRQRRQIANPR